MEPEVHYISYKGPLPDIYSFSCTLFFSAINKSMYDDVVILDKIIV
jgi:hypothetical protein